MKPPASACVQAPEAEAEITRIDQALETGGPGAAIDAAIELLEAADDHRGLLDALVLKARLELGLPLVAPGPSSAIPEPTRTEFEDRYIAAIRRVGERCLAAGDIPAGWTYLRVISELEPVAAAIRAYQPRDDEITGQVIEIAFHHGVEPVRGFELLLEYHGACPAISALEQSPPREESARVACVERLIARLHRDLRASIVAEITEREQSTPAAADSISQLITERGWLFGEDSYHIDVSHLLAAVRYSVLAKAPAAIAHAIDLADYGKRLAARFRYDCPAPFQDSYADYHAYLTGLAGRSVDEAARLFEAKLAEAVREGDDAPACAMALVNLLERNGRLLAAVDVASRHLAEIPEAALSCPTIAQLCTRAGRLDVLADLARGKRDLAAYAAARIGLARTRSTPG